MKLIDKDALVAEIENLKKEYKECPTCNSYEEGLKDGRLIGYKDALHKINTLEVKEDDIEYINNDAFIKKAVEFIRNNETVLKLYNAILSDLRDEQNAKCRK